MRLEVTFNNIHRKDLLKLEEGGGAGGGVIKTCDCHPGLKNARRRAMPFVDACHWTLGSFQPYEVGSLRTTE